MEKRHRHIETPAEFGFGFLEAVLAMPVAVASSNRTAFAHRVKNLLKLADKVGLKLGVGHGAGKATMYGWEDAGVLGVALELTQLGMPPERSMTLIKDNEKKVLTALAVACEAFTVEPEKYALRREGRDKPPPQILMWTDPRILTAAMANSETDPDLFEDYLDFGTPDLFMDRLKEMDYAMPRFIVTNLTSLISLMSMVSATKHTTEMAEKMHYAIVSILHERGDKHLKHLKVNSRGWAGEDTKKDGFDFNAWIQTMSKEARKKPLFSLRRNASAELADLIDRTRPYYIVPDAEGAQFDLIIRMPGESKLMVDAKVSPQAKHLPDAISDRMRQLKKGTFRQSDPYGQIFIYLPSDTLVDEARSAAPGLVEWLSQENAMLVGSASMAAILKSVDAIWDEAKKSETYSAEYNEMVSDHGDR